MYLNLLVAVSILTQGVPTQRTCRTQATHHTPYTCTHTPNSPSHLSCSFGVCENIAHFPRPEGVGDRRCEEAQDHYCADVHQDPEVSWLQQCDLFDTSDVALVVQKNVPRANPSPSTHTRNTHTHARTRPCRHASIASASTGTKRVLPAAQLYAHRADRWMCS